MNTGLKQMKNIFKNMKNLSVPKSAKNGIKPVKNLLSSSKSHIGHLNKLGSQQYQKMKK